jgi:hypothetical protein
MTRKITLILALAAAIVPTSAHAYLPDGFIGVSPQSAANSKDFRLMQEAGIGSVRLPIYWSSVQARSPAEAEADWSGFDREVMLAAEEKIEVMPFIWGTPAWAGEQVIDLPVRSAWQRWGWSRLLRQAAKRYGPEGAFWKENPELPHLPIRRWEIWNEQNIVTFADPVDPLEFAKLVRISGRALHGVDPGAKVILGGFFGRPLQVPPNAASGGFLARLYRARDIKRHFDGVALHPYVARARAMGAQIENLRRIMRRNGDARKPILVTELGWGSNSGPTRWERGLQGQANQLSQAFSMLADNRVRWRVGGVWWFTWTDEGGGCLFCRSAGLLTASRKAKPAWYRFNAWTGGDPSIVPRALFGPAGEELEEAAAPPATGPAAVLAPAPRRR